MSEDGQVQPAPRALRRRRRANAEGGRQHFHKVGVTPEEELRLTVLADQHGVTVPRLLVEAALSAADTMTITERRQSAAELFRVSRLLGTVANNVNQMAKATNATGVVQEDMAATLRYLREVLGPRIEAALEELVEP
ncbi:MAG: MobC family plasmid mobilization relaxosome protein [Cellulomonadaceae bacterium]|nr:MobC family plasmid mobilization relaxosome protein [Cellulomonadaceae bacterium]